MKINQTVILTLCISLFCVVLGCKKNSYPPGFPKIYKCSIKVVDGDGPVNEVLVRLESSNREISKWGPCSTTNSEGVAAIMTRGFEGAPIGEYKVLLEKRGAPMVETSPGIFAAADCSNQLNPDYADSETTPFTLSVEKKQTAIPTFNLADGSTN